ncbi:MAG: siderophore-interacting protein [Microbacteriaceae bacterium]|nr:siderophore-interacting protein [Microbacteriaceae bacterium]
MRVEDVAPRMRRITLGGDDLADFASPGPTDHVKVFFPDPATGELVTPEWVKGRPQVAEGAGELIVRDYTPLAFRAEGEHGPELDLDFVLHGDGGAGGPAAAWAANAKPGDRVRLGGPRGSQLPPTDAESAILVADESALPAVSRWLDALGNIPAVGLFSVEDPDTASYLDAYAGEGRDFRWFSGDDREDRITETLRGLTIDEGTFLFLAGEANSLIPRRRYLRRELGLPKNQVDIRGYWKQGTIALDHHAPLDPADPED